MKDSRNHREYALKPPPKISVISFFPKNTRKLFPKHKKTTNSGCFCGPPNLRGLNTLVIYFDLQQVISFKNIFNASAYWAASAVLIIFYFSLLIIKILPKLFFSLLSSKKRSGRNVLPD